MKNRLRRNLLVIVAVAGALGSSLTAYAAPQTMPDGTVFDAEFYAETYPDVVAALGTDESALYQHYVKHGKEEGRKPHADRLVTEDTLKEAASVHKYYKGLTDQQAAEGDAVAKQIADSIMANTSYTTDCQRITAAAKTVASYCNKSIYGSDVNKYYRSPYGVFVAGVYTCAGSARALGRVLDYMGYSWQHVRENESRHQWCIVTMDGQVGYADGMAGIAGYGELVNGMKLPDGRIIWFAE